MENDPLHLRRPLRPELVTPNQELARRRVHERLDLLRQLPEGTMGHAIVSWYDETLPMIGDWLADCAVAELIDAVDRARDRALERFLREFT